MSPEPVFQQYASAADFVGEVTVVPPLARWASARVTSSNPGCAMAPDGSPPGTGDFMRLTVATTATTRFCR